VNRTFSFFDADWPWLLFPGLAAASLLDQSPAVYLPLGTGTNREATLRVVTKAKTPFQIEPTLGWTE
jgi:hypothetical protein